MYSVWWLQPLMWLCQRGEAAWFGCGSEAVLFQPDGGLKKIMGLSV